MSRPALLPALARALGLCAPLVIVASGCSGDDVRVRLSDYSAEITAAGGSVIYDKLIACAAGGHPGFDGEGAQPISVYFYPTAGENVQRMRLFESVTAELADAEDNAQYREVGEGERDSEPVFNGYLRRFKTARTASDSWVRVTFEIDGDLYIADPIKLKMPDKATENGAPLVDVSFDGKQPTFSWDDGAIKESVIYFEVVIDSRGNLLSGTYTTEKRWKYYDTSNVVLNVTTGTPPDLVSGETYAFILMAVSQDNWVNLVARKEITVP